VDELLMIQESYADLGASSLFDFSLLAGQTRVELGLADSAVSMQRFHQAELHDGRRDSAFATVRMPDEIFESALEVFLETSRDCDPQTLASEVQNPGHVSILRGMGFRRDLLGCLTSLCSDSCDDKALELITQISSVPLSFRDESALLNMDDARAFRGYRTVLPKTTSFLSIEAEQSDTALHERFLNVCSQKLQLCLQSPTHGGGPQHVADLLDFAKALQSVVSLVSDSSSSTFLTRCFGSLQQPLSIFRCCVSLAQFCVNLAASDSTSGTNHAAAAFVLMSIAVSIVQKQKQGDVETPQISKDREVVFDALNDLSDFRSFHSELSKVESSSCCRFVSSWLLACGGQFFKLFRMHEDILSRLVPLREGRLLRQVVRFIRREAFQQYIPSSCLSCLSSHPTFSKEFVAIF
jgi:hypothetical protein